MIKFKKEFLRQDEEVIHIQSHCINLEECVKSIIENWPKKVSPIIDYYTVYIGLKSEWPLKQTIRSIKMHYEEDFIYDFGKV